MFKRVMLEEWHQELLPYLAFGFIFVGFIVGITMAIRMKPSDVEKASRLPLDLEDENK